MPDTRESPAAGIVEGRQEFDSSERGGCMVETGRIYMYSSWISDKI